MIHLVIVIFFLIKSKIAERSSKDALHNKVMLTKRLITLCNNVMYFPFQTEGREHESVENYIFLNSKRMMKI